MSDEPHDDHTIARATIPTKGNAGKTRNLITASRVGNKLAHSMSRWLLGFYDTEYAVASSLGCEAYSLRFGLRKKYEIFGAPESRGDGTARLNQSL
jgi:hypothetical protein